MSNGLVLYSRIPYSIHLIGMMLINRLIHRWSRLIHRLYLAALRLYIRSIYSCSYSGIEDVE